MSYHLGWCLTMSSWFQSSPLSRHWCVHMSRHWCMHTEFVMSRVFLVRKNPLTRWAKHLSNHFPSCYCPSILLDYCSHYSNGKFLLWHCFSFKNQHWWQLSTIVRTRENYSKVWLLNTCFLIVTLSDSLNCSIHRNVECSLFIFILLSIYISEPNSKHCLTSPVKRYFIQ